MATIPKRKAYRDPRQWLLWLQGLVGSRYDGMHNFHVVQEGVLLRSGQPHVRDLDTIRGRHGLGGIVVARGGTRHPLRGRWFRKETAWCARNGVTLLHLPFSDARGVGGEVFEKFLSFAADPAHHPVLVHCEQGFHRTGVLTAAHRIIHQQWPVERAVEEMQRCGFDTEQTKRVPLYRAFRDWLAARQAGEPV